MDRRSLIFVDWAEDQVFHPNVLVAKVKTLKLSRYVSEAESELFELLGCASLGLLRVTGAMIVHPGHDVRVILESHYLVQLIHLSLHEPVHLVTHIAQVGASQCHTPESEH